MHWEGKHRTSLSGQGVWPRPMQPVLPIRLGAGGTPNSFVRAGMLGLPLTVAIIGGEPHRFRPLINLYREAGRRAGHAPDLLDVAVHAIGYVAETDQQAADDLWPAYVHTFTRIGKERGWGPTTRAAFDAQRGPSGAFVVGSPETAAAKMQHISDSLGGVSQVSLMMSGGPLSHNKMLRAIALLGSEVRPRVQQEAAAAIA